MKRAEMASIISGVGVHLGSILGPWSGPHFGRPNRASVTGLSAPRGRPCGRRFRDAPGRPDLGPQILLFDLGAEDLVSFWGPKIGRWLSGAGPELRPKMA